VPESELVSLELLLLQAAVKSTPTQKTPSTPRPSLVCTFARFFLAPAP
jgi:hypothetical protein